LQGTEVREMIRKLVRLLQDESGQSTPEYALLLSIVGTLAVAIAGLAGDMKNIFEQTSHILQQIGVNLQEINTNLSQTLPN